MNNKTDDFIKSHYENRPLDWMFENRFTIKQMLEEFSNQQNKELKRKFTNIEAMYDKAESELSQQKELVEDKEKEIEQLDSRNTELHLNKIYMIKQLEEAVDGSKMFERIISDLQSEITTLKQEIEALKKENGLRFIGLKNSLLEAYSKFLEDSYYIDTDWRAEEPFAIDEFWKSKEYQDFLNQNTQIIPATESQSLRIKQLEEGITKIERQLWHNDLQPYAEQLSQLLSTPTTEVKEGGNDV